jgi:hypothetical protein
VEEVDRKQAVGLGTQEIAPGVVVAGRRRDSMGTLDLADRGGGGPMTEAPQFALDTDYASVPVLLGQAQDERDQFIADRRTTRRFWLSPPRGDQSAMPAQQRSRCDYPVDA